MGIRRSAALIGAALAAAFALSGCATSGSAADLGKPGQPVHLVIGYQPYYTEAWSAVVLRQTGLWKRYLPKGSTVDFKIGLQGSIVAGQMLAGKEQFGYMGDMPSIVAVSKRQIRDLRIIATAGISPDQCGIFLVRPDAPQFSSQEQAIRWLNGKTVATPQGSCTDRVTQAAFQQLGVRPKAYLNQSLELITSDFKNHSIDAATVWEPVPSKLINDGLARRVASSDPLGLTDAAFLATSEQMIKQRPDIVRDWLKAEIAAERYLANSANESSVVNAAVSQTTGYTAKDMRDSLYRAWPTSLGGAPGGVKLQFPFTMGGGVNKLIGSATAFLYKIHAIPTAQLPAGAVDESLAAQVLKQSGLSDPIGQVVGSPSP